LHTDIETGNMPCEAPSRAVTMPRHTRHGHATPHQQKFEKERKNRSKGRRAIHSFHSFIHFTKRESVSSKGKVDMTSLRRPLLFETLDPSCSRTVRRDFDETRRPQRSWDWRNLVYLLHPFSHDGFPTQRSAPLSPFPFRCEQE